MSRIVLVVVPRERFSRSDASLRSLRENTSEPFHLIYVDGASPEPMRSTLARMANDEGIELLRTASYVSPNQARNIGFQAALKHAPEYVVFLDNDLEYRPGWLGHLVRCADETGATVVGPLIHHGGFERGQVHAAGGTVELTDVAGQRVYRHWQRFAHQPLNQVAGQLKRECWENFEFHAVLFRTGKIRPLFPLDEKIFSLFDHDDLVLRVKAAGETVFFEPAAEVTYRFDRLEPYDLEYTRLRWSQAWNEASVRHFARKWDCHPRGPWIAESIEWAARHRRRITGERLPWHRRFRSLVASTLRGARLLGERRPA